MFVEKRKLLLLRHNLINEPPNGLEAIALVRVSDVTRRFDLVTAVLARKVQQALQHTCRLNPSRRGATERPGVRFRPNQLRSTQHPIDAPFDVVDLLRSDVLRKRTERSG